MNKRKVFLIVSIICLCSVITGQGSEPLGEVGAFRHFLKNSSYNNNDFTVEYLYITNKDKYQQIKDDEFKFNSTKQSTRKQIENDLANLNSNTQYLIYTRGEFQEYDFEKGCFTFNPLGENTYFDIKPYVSHSSYYCGKCNTKTKISLFFTNPEDFKDIKMNANDAEHFIDTRKSSSGKVNRGVTFKVFYKLTTDIKTETNENSYDSRIYGEISKIEVYDSYGYKSGTNKMISTITPIKVSKDVSKATTPSEDVNAKIRQEIEAMSVSDETKKLLLEALDQK